MVADIEVTLRTGPHPPNEASMARHVNGNGEHLGPGITATSLDGVHGLVFFEGSGLGHGTLASGSFGHDSAAPAQPSVGSGLGGKYV